MSQFFIDAKPIWIDGKQQEVNCRVQFKAFCAKSDWRKYILPQAVYISFG